jgi:uncharacterized Zn finger protein
VSPGRRRTDPRPPPARGAGSRRGFGHTWWGRAWVEALEARAALDPNRLSRGRAYARRGTVGDLRVEPGAVHAAVQGTRARPYDVMVRVRQFSEQEWAAVLAVVAAQLGRAAALLDGELPPELVDDVAAAGLSLLPGAGELQPRCSCPDWADPCKHSAAVCYLVADLLDADPFGLLLLRGRVRDEVLAELRRLRAGGVAGAESGTSRAAAGGERDDDLTARGAYSREVSEPPVVPLPVRRPGRPAVAALAPPAESGLEREALLALAADAARRAWELATGDGDGGLTLTAEEDVARRAVPLLGGDKLAELARRAGLPSRELARRALAWRTGGAGGLGVLLTAWQPDPDQLADGRAALRARSVDRRRVHTRDNRLTQGGTQLRLGRDGLWYRFGRSFGGWDLVSGPSPDPATLVD